MGASNTGLERDHAVCRRLGLLVACFCQQAGQHGFVGRADFKVFLCIVEIIVTVANAEPGLGHIEDVLVGLLGIDIDPARDRGGVARCRKQLGEVFPAIDVLDFAEIGRGGREASGFDTARVHIGVVDRGDLAFECGWIRFGFGKLLNDIEYALL